MIRNLAKHIVRSLPGIKDVIRERDALRSRVANLQAQHTPPRAGSDQTGAEPELLSFRRSQSSGPQPAFENFGYCHCCSSVTRFTAMGPWWRDQYKCSNCFSIPRERALMYCLETFFPQWRDSIIHESSPGGRGASQRLRAGCANYIPSQYFPDVTPGETHRGFRCENLEALTFADESIDLHVTQDVCEHIFAPDKAFREIARTLRPGGAHIFTVPLVNKDRPTEFRARMNEDGSIEHLVKPPEYHGNPISEKGSLVTVHWGYDICEYIHSASGLYTQIVYIDALDLGIRAEFIEVLITRKPT